MVDRNSYTARMRRVAARILYWADKMATERKMIIAWAERCEDRRMLNAASRFRYAQKRHDAFWQGAVCAGFVNDQVFRALLDQTGGRGRRQDAILDH